MNNSDTSHYENYELPQGWTYATMSDICTKIVDGDHNPPIAQKAESEYIMISSKNVVNDSIIHLDDVRHLSRADFELSNARTQVSKGDVLFTSVASLGRTCIYDLDYPITFQRSVTVICTKIFNRYLKLFLDSPLYQNYVGENARGTAQKGFYINQISDSWVPIPPLNEQIRIVEKAQSLLDIVQIINYSKEETSNNIIALKSKILDLAISGKLVRQDKSDEPAIELLKRINPQYQPTDNRHYENLPETWVEVELGGICQLFDGEKIRDREYVNLDVKYLRGSKNGSKLTSGKYVPKDTLMILVDGENSGEVFITPHEGYQGSTFKLLGISSELNRDYILLLIQHSREHLKDNKVGSAIPHLNKKLFKQIHAPIPPYNEQGRIVNAVQMIMSKLEEILAAL